ncbi:MAG: hypothetical protein QM796_20420 [Chthoniobacteraceae bacterium]
MAGIPLSTKPQKKPPMLKSSKIYQVSQLEKFLLNFSTIICHAAEDFEQAKKGKIIYNLDASLLNPFLFDAQTDFSRQAGPEAIKIIESILHDVSHRVYHLAVSGPAVFEFLDRICRLENGISRPRVTQICSEISSALLTAPKDQLPADLLVKREMLQRVFKPLTTSGLHKCVVTPVEKFLSLLDGRQLSGLADCALLPDNISNERLHQEALTLFRQALTDRRRQDPRGKRHVDFHYWMDALNIVISMYSAGIGDAPSLLLTNTWKMVGYCKKDDNLYGRHFYVASSLNSLCRMAESGYAPDPIEYCHFALEECNRLAANLSHRNPDEPIDHLPGHILDKLKVFFEGTYSNLFVQTEGNSEPQGDPGESEEIAAIISDPRRFKSATDDLHDHVSHYGNQIASRGEQVGTQFLEDYNVHEDPVVANIRQRFKFAA